MPDTELVQAEVAVIEAGIVLAKVKVRLVEAKIEAVKTCLESAVGSMAAKVLAIEAEVEAVKENIRMVEAKVRLFRAEPDPAISHAERLSSALRAHIELDNDKLSVAMRELDQVDRDIRILVQPQQPGFEKSDKYPLRGSPLYRYEGPFEPAVPEEDWEVYK